MRTALLACTLAVTAMALAPAYAQDGSVTVFPPLYRDMARETAKVRPSPELTVTPQPVAASRQPDLIAEQHDQTEEPVRTGSTD